jgi:hypothetical protein
MAACRLCKCADAEAAIARARSLFGSSSSIDVPNSSTEITGAVQTATAGRDRTSDMAHVVPLLDAWEMGAQEWDQIKRTQFANDPLDRLAVSGKANRKKKAGDVASWLPSNTDFSMR